MLHFIMFTMQATERRTDQRTLVRRSTVVPMHCRAAKRLVSHVHVVGVIQGHVSAVDELHQRAKPLALRSTPQRESTASARSDIGHVACRRPNWGHFA